MSEQKSAHTPGRWFYEPCTDTVRRYTNPPQGWFEHADGQRMADAMNACEGIADPSAVADLLAACKVAAEHLSELIESGVPGFAQLHQLTAAIRKATGGTWPQPPNGEDP